VNAWVSIAPAYRDQTVPQVNGTGPGPPPWARPPSTGTGRVGAADLVGPLVAAAGVGPLVGPFVAAAGVGPLVGPFDVAAGLVEGLAGVPGLLAVQGLVGL
jgi:hypothetical protein